MARDTRITTLSNHNAPVSIHGIDMENRICVQLSKLSERLLSAIQQFNFSITSKTAKISLSVNERIAQREILRHTYQGRVDHSLTVGVVVTADIAGDLGTFTVRSRRREVEVPHSHKNAAMYRFQTVPDIG
jgi:hypothetical protein